MIFLANYPDNVLISGFFDLLFNFGVLILGSLGVVLTKADFIHSYKEPFCDFVVLVKFKIRKLSKIYKLNAKLEFKLVVKFLSLSSSSSTAYG